MGKRGNYGNQLLVGVKVIWIILHRVDQLNVSKCNKSLFTVPYIAYFFIKMWENQEKYCKNIDLHIKR